MPFVQFCRFCSTFIVSIQMLVDRVAMRIHEFTLYSFVRPFGCSVLFCSYDEDGPHLYSIEPSGTCYVIVHLVLYAVVNYRLLLCVEITFLVRIVYSVQADLMMFFLLLNNSI